MTGPNDAPPRTGAPERPANHPHDWQSARHCRSCGFMEVLDNESNAPDPSDVLRTALAAAQADMLRLREEMARIVAAHADAAYSHDAQRLDVFNFVAGVASRAIVHPSADAGALREMLERAAEMGYEVGYGGNMKQGKAAATNIVDRILAGADSGAKK